MIFNVFFLLHCKGPSTGTCIPRHGHEGPRAPVFPRTMGNTGNSWEMLIILGTTGKLVSLLKFKET